MPGEKSLVGAFVATLGDEMDASAGSELGTQLEGIVARARAQWPDIQIEPEDYVRYLAVRVAPPLPPLEALAQLATTDLYLACGCAHQHPDALKEFERRYGDQITRCVARFKANSALTAEVRQDLMDQLLVAGAGRPPGIVKYLGRGSLASWVRVAATHLALRLSRHEQRELPDEERLLEAASTASGDPELEYLKLHYREQFRVAFHAAMETLDARERNLLRHHLVDGMSIDAIGQRFGIHRSTAARWLERVRSTLADRTRELMTADLEVSDSEYESIVRIIQSQLDFTISGYLQDRPVDTG
jgi:RNA polymerase sigma-70 factor (ECF subfamily)